MKYDKITIYYDKNDNFIKAVIETKYGDLEFKNKEEFDQLIKEYAEQIGVPVAALYEHFIKVEKQKNNVEANTDLIELTGEELNTVLEDNSVKQKKYSWVVRLIAYAAVVTVLGTGGYHIYKNREKIKAYFKSGTKSEERYKNNNSHVIQQLVSNENISDLDSSEILNALSENLNKTNDSLFEVSEYINNRELSGNPKYYNFEKLFNSDSQDYYAVKAFSDMRNEIIRNVFEDNDKNKAIENIKEMCKKYIEFSIIGKPVEFKYDNKTISISFANLSEMAKLTILELCDGIFCIDCDYVYNDENYIYDKYEIIEMNEIERNNLLRILTNKGYRK